MQNISVSSSKSRRTIYSSFVFPTGNIERRPGDLKSSSFCGFAEELNGRLANLGRHQDSGTQTSKTILELAQIESGSMSPDSLNASPKAKTKILRNTNTQTSVEALDSSEGYASCENDRVFEFVESRSSQPPPNSANLEEEDDDDDVAGVTVVRHRRPKERCATPFVETHHPNYVPDVTDADKSRSVTPSNSSERVETAGKTTATTNSSSISSSSPRSSTRGVKTTTTPGVVTYMAPTISSENKNAQHVIRRLNRLFDAPKRGRSSSPRFAGTPDVPGAKVGGSVPYVERSVSTVSYDAARCARPTPSSKSSMEGSVGESSVDFLYDKETLRKGSDENIILSSDNLMSTPLAKIKDPDWNTCIQGLAEIIDCCRMTDLDQIYPHMTIIYQKLIELLRSPRSHVCRTSCQAAGNLFEFVRDTRRPEFDEVVDLLLFKTADANKFIRQDANLALDCMVTHIPTAHAIRALCSKGPAHKNYLVRTATVRLIVCAVVIAGPESVLNPANSEQTRKKIFYHMPKFVEDKNLEVRKFGERLYKVLSKEFRFNLYLKKYLDKEEVLNMKKNIRNMTFKS